MTLLGVCKHCGVAIELSSNFWWEAGTCVWMCIKNDDKHEPVLPDLADRPAVEAWLDA